MELLQKMLGDRVRINEPLSKHTYFKLGGPAEYFFEATSTDDLCAAVESAIHLKIPYFVLGGGSNIIVTDKGIRGLVIKNKSNKIKVKGFTGKVVAGSNQKVALSDVVVQADSGVPANMLIRYTVDEGLQGLEDMLGLPGTVGGAVYNNSHHLDKLFGDRIVEVEVLTREGKRHIYKQKDMQFAYDYSILHKTHETILNASFELKRGTKEELWAIANEAVKRRSTTQPLGAPSSGCIFQNIPLADAMRLGLPTTDAGKPIQSAGYLIDKAGLKGLTIGGASVSDKHANFIVQNGHATYSEVMELVEKIKKEIKAKYGVDLVLEVFVVGEK